ncbi:arginase [Azospira restricta]|uniref:Arginase n=1 Tax=Azospira restricta TaxID=404405 RepID=A0A974SMG7_9RHOO|nr:arginase [Azospira restricta]QRJ62650.1 arginase [Azospira restricta]
MPQPTPPRSPSLPRRLRIIGAASGVGAQDHECEHGPVAFHRSQAWHELEHHPLIDWGETLYAPDRPGLSPLERIAQLCARLADAVAQARAAGEFPLVLGGDHSVAIGTWSGVARTAGEPLGLLWIDAHMDSHTPETTHSGAIHGMPLACLLGRGDKRLLGFGLPGRQLLAAHTVVLGPRSYETEEAELLQRLGVRVIGAEEIAAKGFAAAFAEAVAIVAAAPHGFGLTLDLDAFDPRLVPGVGSPEPDGLGTWEVIEGLRALARAPGLLALEIVEYNPDRDRGGVTADLIADLIAAVAPPGRARG